MSPGFGFVHKKRVSIKNEQGTTFDFEHKKRIFTITHPGNIFGGEFSGGAFSDAFDHYSFWVGVATGFYTVLNNVNEFFFKHIKRTE